MPYTKGSTSGGGTGLQPDSTPGNVFFRSSYAGGDDDGAAGHYDSTSRLNLYSYQRANVNSLGETVRNYLMRSDAKAMQAWYLATTGTTTKVTNYDTTSRDPLSGTTFRPVVWTGAHFEANDHGSIHAHYEIEVPDSTGALQGRLEIPFADQSKLSNGLNNTTVGIDYTNIRTNLADFTVRAQAISSGDYAGNTTCLRVGAGNTVNKDIRLSISSDMQSSGNRWAFRANTDTETGGGTNSGTNLQIIRHADDGTVAGTALFIQRSDGQITTGAAAAKSARFAAVWGTSGIAGFSAQPSATIGASAAFDAQMSASTERVVNAKVTGEASQRFVAYVSGKHEWGDGTNARDTTLYRSAASTLTTDGTFQAAALYDNGNRTYSLSAPPPNIQPADHGYKLMNYDPAVAVNTGAPTAGVLTLLKVSVRATATVSNIAVAIATAATGLTANQCYGAIYDSTGNRVAVTGDVSTLFGTALVRNLPLTASATLNPGFYWVALLFNGTTPPTLCRVSGSGSAVVNAGLSATTYRFATQGSALTATPASITPSSNANGTTSSYWVGLS